MAPLTWRNVDRVGFGDSVAALRLSGDLLNRGFEMGDRALSEFDTWRTEQNDRTALAAAQRIQDPAAYRAALESGTALGGIAPTALSSRALGLLDARSADLTTRDAAQFANNRTQATAAAEDAAAPQVAALSEALRRGDSAGAQAIAGRLSLAGVPLARIQEIYRGFGQQEQAQATIEGTRAQTANTIAGTENTRVGTQGRRIDNEANQFRLDELRRGSADQQAAAAAVQNVLDGSADAAGARRIFDDQMRENRMSPTAAGLARGLLQQYYPDLYGPIGGPAGTPAPGSRPAAGAAIAAAAQPAGGGPPPVGSSAIIDAIPDNVRQDGTRTQETRNYVRTLTQDISRAGIDLSGSDYDRIARDLAPLVQRRESSNRPGATSSAGAQGLMQLMPDTARELERRLGMREGLTSENTPEGRAANQRAGTQYLADQLRAHNGNVELALAAYNAGPNRVAQWRRTNPAFEAAIAGGNAGARLVSGQEGVRNAGVEGRADRSRDVSQTGAARIAAAFSDERSSQNPAEVARELRARLEFNGVNQNYLERQIREIAREANVSFAVAGEIVARNTRPQVEGFWNSAGNTLAAAVGRVIPSVRPDVNLPGGRQLDRAGINADITRWGGQAGVRAVQEVNNRAADLLRLQQAEAAATQATTAFEQFRARAANQPALARELARYEAAANAALLTLERLRDRERRQSEASRGPSPGR